MSIIRSDINDTFRARHFSSFICFTAIKVLKVINFIDQCKKHKYEVNSNQTSTKFNEKCRYFHGIDDLFSSVSKTDWICFQFDCNSEEWNKSNPDQLFNPYLSGSSNLQAKTGANEFHKWKPPFKLPWNGMNRFLQFTITFFVELLFTLCFVIQLIGKLLKKKSHFGFIPQHPPIDRCIYFGIFPKRNKIKKEENWIWLKHVKDWLGNWLYLFPPVLGCFPEIADSLITRLLPTPHYLNWLKFTQAVN